MLKLKTTMLPEFVVFILYRTSLLLTFKLGLLRKKKIQIWKWKMKMFVKTQKGKKWFLISIYVVHFIIITFYHKVKF